MVSVVFIHINAKAEGARPTKYPSLQTSKQCIEHRNTEQTSTRCSLRKHKSPARVEKHTCTYRTLNVRWHQQTPSIIVLHSLS